MAIGTDAAIHFFGTQDSLDDTSAAVTSGSFSVAGDLLTWTNDDDAIEASVTLEGTFSVAPDANSSVALFAALQDVQSTNDDSAPTVNYQHTFLGSFPVKDVTSNQFTTISIALPNAKSSQIYQFYIRNQTGQTISAAWDVHITPRTVGPHA